MVAALSFIPIYDRVISLRPAFGTLLASGRPTRPYRGLSRSGHPARGALGWSSVEVISTRPATRPSFVAPASASYSDRSGKGQLAPDRGPSLAGRFYRRLPVHSHPRAESHRGVALLKGAIR